MARTALNLRMTNGDLTGPISWDLVLSLRSLIAEVEYGSGIDVWIVVNMEKVSAKAEAEWMRGLPLEFKQ